MRTRFVQEPDLSRGQRLAFLDHVGQLGNLLVVRRDLLVNLPVGCWCVVAVGLGGTLSFGIETGGNPQVAGFDRPRCCSGGCARGVPGSRARGGGGASPSSRAGPGARARACPGPGARSSAVDDRDGRPVFSHPWSRRGLRCRRVGGSRWRRSARRSRRNLGACRFVVAVIVSAGDGQSEEQGNDGQEDP